MFLHVSSIQLITIGGALVPSKPTRLRYNIGVRSAWTATKCASEICDTALLGSTKAWIGYVIYRNEGSIRFDGVIVGLMCGSCGYLLVDSFE